MYYLKGIDGILSEIKRVLISGIGGGGDCLTALHVRWSLEKIAPHIEWIHGGVTEAPITQFENIGVIDDSSAWIMEESTSKPPFRLIESFIAKEIGERVFLLSVQNGVVGMIRSLTHLVRSYNIDMFLFIDGGSDALSFTEGSMISPVEDTMALSAIGLGRFPKNLKYRILGLSAVGSDGEMSLEEFGKQLLKVTKAGGYRGGTFFPAERLYEYAAIVGNVLEKYPTGTALAPLYATNTPFDNPTGMYNPFINGIQLATFFVDAQIAAEYGNDFTHAVFEAKSRDEAFDIITRKLKGRKKRIR